MAAIPHSPTGMNRALPCKAELKGTADQAGIREALARILASPDFDATDRIRRFLSYVVEETLSGRPDRIKAYSIATSVFGRDESFDPQIDSIVRIVAGRMRRSLERYYLTGGKDDPLRIRIPKGSYVPVFELIDTESDGPANPQGIEKKQTTGIGPSILIEPFTREGDQTAYPSFSRGLTRSLTIGLARFTNLRVFGTEALSSEGLSNSDHEAGNRIVDYVLSGGTTIESDRFDVDILLVHARTGRAVWADRFEGQLNPSEIYSLRKEVANGIARTLAQPYGVIHSDRAFDAEGSPPESLNSYDCVLRFYQYWRTFDPSMVDGVRQCLERTIQSEPRYAEAFACLSLVYSNINRFRNRIDIDKVDPRQRALVLADRAIELAPNSSWSHYARSLAYWFVGDVEAGLAALETGYALNPCDTTIAADLGQRYAMLGQWEKGVPLLEQSFARNPSQPGGYRIGLFLYHFAHGRFHEALSEARRMGTPHVIYQPVAIAMAAAELGRTDEADAAIRRLAEIDPTYGDHVVADLNARNLRPDLVAMVVDGLRKAGLRGKDIAASQAALV